MQAIYIDVRHFEIGVTGGTIATLLFVLIGSFLAAVTGETEFLWLPLIPASIFLMTLVVGLVPFGRRDPDNEDDEIED